jgi:NADPH:quinone reductase-like Zn-dependent oxidoreductase
MQVDEVEDPKPEPGELLVKTGAAGVNPVDVAIRAAKHPYAKLVKPPYIPGAEAAGEIVGMGEGVEGFQIGQRVYGRVMGGGYAELVRLPANTAAELPEAYSFEEGAGLTVPFYTAWNALVIKAEASAGETVLVQGGAGGVGMASIADRCQELTGGRGVDIIVELNSCDNFDKDLDAICVDGRVIVIGTGTGKGPMAEFRVPAVMTKDARVLGLAVVNLFPKMPEVVRRFTPILREGSLKVNVDRAVPMADSNVAHEVVLGGKFLGKVVLTP